MISAFFRFSLLFTFFFLINTGVRYSAIGDAFYINDDAGLITTAIRNLEKGELHRLFYNSYGPRIIRPFQLIGMAIENGHFGLSISESLLIGLGILSLSQTILVTAFQSKAISFGAVGGALFLGLTPVSGEPTLWLADRHDLYLLLFSSLAVLSTMRGYSAVTSGAWRRWNLLLVGSVWGAFFSNEKATALPVLCGIVSLYAHRESRQGDAAGRCGIHLALLAALIGSYLIFRYAVIGALVGGYDNRILPPNGLSASFVMSIAGNLAALPIRAASSNEAIIQAVCLLVFMASFFPLLRRMTPGQTGRQIFLVGSALVVASIPTLKYLSVFSVEFTPNMRVLWMPALVYAFIFSALLHAIRRSKWEYRWFPCSLFALYLIAMSVQTYAAANQFRMASNASRIASEWFGRYCHCVDLTAQQSEGLPPLVGIVNAFTEPGWMQYLAYRTGVRECSSSVEERCYLRFRYEPNGMMSVFPTRHTTTLVESAPSQFDLRKAHSYPITSHIEAFSVTARDTDTAELLISGWAFHRDSGKPIRTLLVTIDDEHRYWSPPNVVREPMPGAQGGPDYFGFEFSVTGLSPGTHIVNISAVRKSSHHWHRSSLVERTISVNSPRPAPVP